MMGHTRQRIRAWIRESGTFDGVIDFDAVLRDPIDRTHLNPDFNSGDYLHPNVKAFMPLRGRYHWGYLNSLRMVFRALIDSRDHRIESG
jgi:hypothetical protein